MFLKYMKIVVILISFIFLTGFLPFITLLGPGYTVATSGSFYKASAQYFINKSISIKGFFPFVSIFIGMNLQFIDFKSLE